MPKVIPITDDEKDLLVRRRRGRKDTIARPILQSFLESGLEMAKLDMEDDPRPIAAMISLLRYFVNRYEMPVRVVKRRDSIFLTRLEEEEE